MITERLLIDAIQDAEEEGNPRLAAAYVITLAEMRRATERDCVAATAYYLENIYAYPRQRR